jgi:hypothetical protein
MMKEQQYYAQIRDFGNQISSDISKGDVIQPTSQVLERLNVSQIILMGLLTAFNLTAILLLIVGVSVFGFAATTVGTEFVAIGFILSTLSLFASIVGLVSAFSQDLQEKKYHINFMLSTLNMVVLTVTEIFKCGLVMTYSINQGGFNLIGIVLAIGILMYLSVCLLFAGARYKMMRIEASDVYFEKHPEYTLNKGYKGEYELDLAVSITQMIAMTSYTSLHVLLFIGFMTAIVLQIVGGMMNVPPNMLHIGIFSVGLIITFLSSISGCYSTGEASIMPDPERQDLQPLRKKLATGTILLLAGISIVLDVYLSISLSVLLRVQHWYIVLCCIIAGIVLVFLSSFPCVLASGIRIRTIQKSSNLYDNMDQYEEQLHSDEDISERQAPPAMEKQELQELISPASPAN